MCRASNPGSVNTKAYCTNEKSRYDWAWWKSSIFIWQFSLVFFFCLSFSSLLVGARCCSLCVLFPIRLSVYERIWFRCGGCCQHTSYVFVVPHVFHRKIASIHSSRGAQCACVCVCVRMGKCTRCKRKHSQSVASFRKQCMENQVHYYCHTFVCVWAFVRMSFAWREANWWRKWKLSRRK